jgi:hypothetical protein
MCYLNEKWFYLFSRSKKSKNLPQAPFEEVGVLWVPQTELIYLVIDNAGSQWTQEAIEEYTRKALEDVPVVFIWQ